MTGPADMLKAVRPPRQRRVLALLALFFVVSGLLRLGQMDTAIAATGDTQARATIAVEQCSGFADVDIALDAISGRAEELDLIQSALDERQTQVGAAERLIEARLAELEAAEQRLQSLLNVADDAAASDVDQLISVYEAMSSEDASELFAEMDPNFAAGFIARMRPDAGAGILAELEPQRAYAISVILATRNADVPRSPQADAP